VYGVDTLKRDEQLREKKSRNLIKPMRKSIVGGGAAKLSCRVLTKLVAELTNQQPADEE